MFERPHLLQQVTSTKQWDFIIIGGGASGLGIALDAASRGFKTLLLEQYDFAKGTSSKSTKLLHGGVRYLAQGDIKLVMEALEERGLLKKNAQHLFHKQEFIIPNYTWWKGPYYWVGLKLYDVLAKKFSLGASTYISKNKVTQGLPTIKSEGLANGISYFDGQFDDARLALNIAQTAIQEGATVINYCKVTRFNKSHNSHINEVVFLDQETQKEYIVKGKVIVNATGVFTDSILKMLSPNHKKTVVPSQGIHLMLAGSFLNSNKAIMIPKTSDGRVLFIIPWYNKVIAGTTDTLIKKPKIEPKPLEEEVYFILSTINQYLTKKATKEDILSVFSGLRPLAKPDKDSTKTKEVSRSHKIIINKNLVTIIGGKWTTYRKMAEDVIDKSINNFKLNQVATKTKEIEIIGNTKRDKNKSGLLSFYGAHLVEINSLEKLQPEWSQKLHPNYPFKVVHIVWAVKNEMARTVEDFLSRRIRLLLLDVKAALKCAPIVAKTMGQLLEKDKKWEEAQVLAFKKLAQQYLLK